MIKPARQRMTSDEFLDWAMRQPEGSHFELVAGEVVEMAPERAAHGRAKGNLYRSLRNAIDAAGLPSEVFVDRMAVEIDRSTTYEPDILVRCGAPLPNDALKVTDPIVVVEVLSPSSRARDTGAKLEDYFRLPSVRHYVIIKTENHAIIHHRRDASGTISTQILREGWLRLDPPGIELRDLLP